MTVHLRSAVIGRAADTQVARAWPAHDVLPAQGWSLESNIGFLQTIVQTPQPVYLASPICRGNLVDERGGLTLFARELTALSRAGFTRAGDWLLPPDPFCRALAADPVGVYQRIRRRALDGHPNLPEIAPTIALLGMLCPRLEPDVRAVLAAGVPYVDALRLAHRFAVDCDEDVRAGRDLPIVFQPKVGEELEPLVALFPDVIAFPTLEALDIAFFVDTRLVPVHPLGLVMAPLFGDGQLMSPLEYFLHDVDHARYMVREELLSRGIDLPDAYQSLDGGPPTTLIDARRNLHRTILDGARPQVAAARLSDGARLDQRARLAAALRRWCAELEPRRAQAVTLLLFEILHEKGFPLDGSVLRRELATGRHAPKLRCKLDRDFYGERLRPDAATVALLEDAEQWLAMRA
jgi:hypothetical protein